MVKANYTITSAKAMLTRNKGRFEGKMILIDFPGIKVLGAIDFLKTKGYGWKKEIPIKKKPKFSTAAKKAFPNIVKNFEKIVKGLNAPIIPIYPPWNLISSTVPNYCPKFHPPYPWKRELIYSPVNMVYENILFQV